MIRAATPDDVPVIAELIRGLAEYERLADQVVLDEGALREHLFGARPYAEVVLAVGPSPPGPLPHKGRGGERGVDDSGGVVGFALFFHNYSTFLGRPGIYLEDLFVRPEHRGAGHGKALLSHLARLAVERGCGRLEWSVLDWNEPSIAFYRSLGAVAMDEWTVYRLAGDALTELARS